MQAEMGQHILNTLHNLSVVIFNTYETEYLEHEKMQTQLLSITLGQSQQMLIR